MSCESCSHWENCSFVDYKSKRLIRPCFKGTTLRLDTAEVDNYMQENRDRVLSPFNLILLSARQESARDFIIKALKVKSQDGAKYICKILNIPIHYSSSTSKFSLFIKGIDFSMTRMRFKRLFRLDVTDEVANRHLGLGFESKEEKDLVKQIREENERYMQERKSNLHKKGAFKHLDCDPV